MLLVRLVVVLAVLVAGLPVIPARALGKDRSRNRESREMLVPYNASGPDARPMQELLAACKERGVWPFIHFNRTHVVPPCTTTADELAEELSA